MAVSANNLGKLINQNKPYVHSNINNFHAIHTQSLVRVKTGNRIEKTIEGLEKVKQELKHQTSAFLNGMTPKQFLKQYYFGGGEKGENKYAHYEAFTKYIETPTFYQDILKYAGYNITKILHILSYKKTEELSNIMSLDKIAEAFVDSMFIKSRKKNKGKWDLEQDLKGFELLNTSEGLEGLKEFFKKNTSPIYTTLKKELKEELKKTLKSDNMIIQAIQSKLLSSECENFVEDYVKHKLKKTWDKETHYFYANRFSKILTKQLTNIGITSSQHLSGAIGEQFEISLVKAVSGKELGEVKVIGNINEEQARKFFRQAAKNVSYSRGGSLNGSGAQKLSQTGNDTSWKNLQKSSYSDFTLVNPENGMVARVQSKYYQGVVEKFEKGKQNINQHISLFSNEGEESIIEFIERFQSTGQVFADVDPAAIAYVIANSLWFSHYGSLDSNNKKQNVSMDNRAIFQEIGSGIGNFLGVIVDEQLTPIMDFSNLFFLINNEVLLPTWTIIEELISVIKYNHFNSKLANFSVNKGGSLSLHTSALAFKKEKLKAVAKDELTYNEKNYRGVFFHNGGYTNEDLVDVGTTMGEKIISNTKIQMRNINLNINYERAIKSAYNLFK